MSDVICRACRGSYHETTDKYTTDRVCDGSMLKLKEKYVKMGWTSFPEHSATCVADIECPQCGTQYCLNGKLKLREELKEEPNDTNDTSLDAQIKELHDAGATSTEIAKALNLGHYMTVVHRLKELNA